MIEIVKAPSWAQQVVQKAFDQKVESLIRQCDALIFAEPTHTLTFCFAEAAFNELSAQAIIDGWYRQVNSRLYRKSIENWKNRAIPLLYIRDKQSPDVLTYCAWARLPSKHIDQFGGVASTVFEPVESYGATLNVEPVLPGADQFEAVSNMFALWESSAVCRPNVGIPPMLH